MDWVSFGCWQLPGNALTLLVYLWIHWNARGKMKYHSKGKAKRAEQRMSDVWLGHQKTGSSVEGLLWKWCGRTKLLCQIKYTPDYSELGKGKAMRKQGKLDTPPHKMWLNTCVHILHWFVWLNTCSTENGPNCIMIQVNIPMMHMTSLFI